MEGQLRRVRLRLATVVVIIFVFVSSGAFGLEDMVGWSGPGIALLLLLVLAAVVLRVREPALERPFRVWGNTAVLAAICAPAVAIAVIALFTNGTDWLVGGLAGVLTGPIAYLVFKPLCRPKAAAGPTRRR